MTVPVTWFTEEISFFGGLGPLRNMILEERSNSTLRPYEDEGLCVLL